MDQPYNQSDVAYENSPKEVNTKRGMPASKQFGKGKMPQDDTQTATKGDIKRAIKKHNKLYHHGEKPYSRHKEHR